MVFGNGHELCRTIDFAGRCDDAALNAKVLGRLHNIERSADVGVHIRAGRVIGIRNGDQGREVHDGFAVCHGGAHPVGIAHITRKYIYFTSGLLGDAVQPTPRIETVVEHKSANIVASGNKCFNKVRTDETIRTGDQNFS